MSEQSESSRESAQGSDFLRELAKAVEDEQFFLVYQPEIDLHSNAFVGVESLIRWRHPQRGVLSPDAFVPELESSGLILGHWRPRALKERSGTTRAFDSRCRSISRRDSSSGAASSPRSKRSSRQ